MLADTFSISLVAETENIIIYFKTIEMLEVMSITGSSVELMRNATSDDQRTCHKGVAKSMS